MKKIKILGIAPYEGMKSMMLKLAKTRDDIDLTVYVGDLNEGVEIAKRNFYSDYDVIISRGGTAELIGEATDIPLVEISLSVYDILRAIKLAENYSERYAIVGYPSITSSAQLLCDLLQYKIDIFTIHNIDEVQSTLTSLKQKDYRMVLCDMITKTTAKKLGLNAILITSGNESINIAFDQAVKLFQSYLSIKEDNRFLEKIIRGYGGYTLVFDTEKNLVFSYIDLENADAMIQVLKKEIPETLASGTHKCFKTIDETLYSITGKKITNRHRDYAVFYISSDHLPKARSKYGIKCYNRSQAEESFFNSFYSLTNITDDFRANLEQMSQSLLPIMVIGEIGTGKSPIAGLLYAQSPLSNNPYITIDCSLINDKGWGFLTNHYSSPLNDNNNTLFFKDLHALSEPRCKQLLTMITDMNIHKRNRMIFSYASKQGESKPAEALKYMNKLSCVTIYLQPLRERTEEIPTMTSLYLSTLNLNLVKQIIGFEPEALTLLQDYHWPYNYTQFKRVLKELAVITTTPYITISSVETSLSKERTELGTASIVNSNDKESLFHSIRLNRTLDEINREIIALCLKDTGGNQSAAAKRLGISRTTLWRYLK